jgi:hypothetical protein
VVFSLQKKYNLIEFYSWAWVFLHTIIFNIIIYTLALNTDICGLGAVFMILCGVVWLEYLESLI